MVKKRMHLIAIQYVWPYWPHHRQLQFLWMEVLL